MLLSSLTSRIDQYNAAHTSLRMNTLAFSSPTESDILPKEITKDKDTGIHTASFGYYDGIAHAKKLGLLQTTDFADVRRATHFIVCCGDVMCRVGVTDYPSIERRII